MVANYVFKDLVHTLWELSEKTVGGSVVEQSVSEKFSLVHHHRSSVMCFDRSLSPPLVGSGEYLLGPVLRSKFYVSASPYTFVLVLAVLDCGGDVLGPPLRRSIPPETTFSNSH